MAYRRSYVIFAPPPASSRRAGPISRHRRAGRHRLGTPGTAPRVRPRRRSVHRRNGRHRQPGRPALSALRYGGLAGLLGTLVASSWFAIAGAAAAAQMIHP